MQQSLPTLFISLYMFILVCQWCNFNKVLRCYLGIPSKVQNVIFNRKTDSLVVIQWFPPSRKINTVFYDIGCFKCRGDVCDDPCGRKPTYKPSNVDFTWTNVTVENLEANTQYMFVVYSKNNNSVLINGSKWLSVRKRVETEGIFVLIFVSSCSSYALR